MDTNQDEPEQSGTPAAPTEAAAHAAPSIAPDALPAEAVTTKPAPDAAPATPEGERIAKAIARAGLASRRDAEVMIEEGRVAVNGQTLRSPALNVTDADHIVVDGEPLPARERTRLWLLHKPRGVVTTARDPEGRQTVFDVLPDDLPRVVAIGRLDINTEGLLLLTNDGGLAKVIAHPETGWLRRYRVRAFGDITQADLDKLRRGVTIDDMSYGPVEATLDRAQGDNVWLTLGLREGKNREVKRILEYLGLSVNRLIRVSFGPFQLGDLEMGLVEEIRTKVLKEQLGNTLSEQAGVDFTSPVREPISPFGKPPKAAKSDALRPARGGSRTERTSAPRGRDGGRPTRDTGRPGTSARTGGGKPAAGAGKATAERSTTWHAEDALRTSDATRIPRRGGDPKQARAAAAERGRERVGAIKTGERRVLVERLQQAAAPEATRRVPPRSRADATPRGEAPMRRERTDDRADRPNNRASERAASGERRSERPQTGDRTGGSPARGERSGARPERSERTTQRPERSERTAQRPERSERPERSGGFQSRGDRPSSANAGAPRGAPRSGGFKDAGGTGSPRRDRTDRDGAPPRSERSGGGYKGGERSFKGDGRPDRGGAPPRGERAAGGYKGGERSSKSGERGDGRPDRGGFKAGKPTEGRSGGGAGFGKRPGGSAGGRPEGRPSGGFAGKPGGRPGGFGGGKPGGRPGGGGKPGGRPGGGGKPGPRGSGPPRAGR